MTGRRELPPIPPIPEPERPDWLDAFLAAHPEKRKQIEEAQQRAAEERETAALVVIQIYEHFATGAPSPWGLIVTLRAFANFLDENTARRPGARGRP